jgi:hypothetical protein
MRKFTIAAIAMLAIAGSTAVYAQYRPWFRDHMHHMRFSPEDRAAFVDARIAAVHAGLKLNADQEKLWPPIEGAVRDFAKLRIDRAQARMKAQDDAQSQQDDPVARLYKTLDDGQKRRLSILTHHGRFGDGEGGWRHRWMEHRMERDMDRGPDRDGRGGNGGPERL